MLLVHINFPKLQQQRSDYGFHGYGELCDFVYCLLLKTRRTESLPTLNEWEKFMSEEKVAEFPSIAMETFLLASDFGRELLAGKTSEFSTFRVRCREFLDWLILTILKSPSVTSRVARGLYCFCPELMLEGDGQLVFQLFPEMCRILESCGSLSSDESKAAVEEFSSYVVEKRVQHEVSQGVASDIPDIVSWLLRDFRIKARHHVCRVLKLYVLVTGRPRMNCPVVSFDLSGSRLSVEKFQECFRLVQSYVLSPGYVHKSFSLM